MDGSRREVVGLEHGGIIAKIAAHGMAEDIDTPGIEQDAFLGVFDHATEDLRGEFFEGGDAGERGNDQSDAFFFGEIFPGFEHGVGLVAGAVKNQEAGRWGASRRGVEEIVELVFGTGDGF